MRAFSGASAPGRLLKSPVAGAPTLVCVCVLMGAAAVAQTASQALRKAPPDPRARVYGARLSALIEERYPELATSGKQPGTPVVTVLFHYDGTVAGTHLEFAQDGKPSLTLSEAQFARFGLSADRMQYIGMGHIKLSGTEALVVFAAEDSSDLDRALVERFFPKALAQHAPAEDQLWILFDHEGQVLRVGEESIAPKRLRQSLETRFPSVHTADMTTNLVLGQDGQPLEDAGHHQLRLDCIWLTADSPPPPH